MVSTKTVNVKYSNRLDSMVEFIKKYLDQCKKQEDIEEVQNGILEFCYNYPREFSEEMHRKIGLKQKPSLTRKSSRTILDKFVNHLAKKDSECIFLLRDTFVALKKYKKRANKGFGILINRKYLFDKEEDYFLLIEIFYKSLLKARNKKEFIEIYFSNFRDMIMNNNSLMDKSIEICKYVESHRKAKSIIWVDLGFHFTFCLFGLCSMRLHSKHRLKQSIFLFSVYPWLRQFFKHNYFSTKNEYVIDLENEAVLQYNKLLIGR